VERRVGKKNGEVEKTEGYIYRKRERERERDRDRDRESERDRERERERQRRRETERKREINRDRDRETTRDPLKLCRTTASNAESHDLWFPWSMDQRHKQNGRHTDNKQQHRAVRTKSWRSSHVTMVSDIPTVEILKFSGLSLRRTVSLRRLWTRSSWNSCCNLRWSSFCSCSDRSSCGSCNDDCPW